MTREEFTQLAGSAARHLLTLGAGALAVHGIAGGDQLVSAGSAAAVFAATLGWSFIEKSTLLSRICNSLPVSELEMLGKMIANFRSKGSNPLLIANIAQAALAVANAELINAHPELAPQRPADTAAAQTDPRPEPVAPATAAAAPASGPLSPPDTEQAPSIGETL